MTPASFTPLMRPAADVGPRGYAAALDSRSNPSLT